MNTCLFCGSEIPDYKKFCNRSHAASFNNKGKRKWGNAPGVCAYCGKPKSCSKSTFCSNRCYADAKKKEKANLPEIKRTVDWLKYYYKRKRELHNSLGGRCAICGSTENLQFDHIDPSTKSRDISHSIRHSLVRNELSKCQLLCRKCHRQKSGKETSNRIKGINNFNSKLTPEIVKNIKLLLEEGHSLRKIGLLYSVSGPTIFAIKKGLTWKEV